MSDRSVVNAGPGLGTLLLVLFIGLKLTGNIHWSWVWVLSPLWIGVVAAVVIIAVAFAIGGIMEWRERRRWRKAAAARAQPRKVA